MEPLLQCEDRWGREILLSVETWFGHIIRRHGELLENLDSIEQAIVHADAIHRDVLREDRETFYRFGVLHEPYQHLYLKVIVEFVESEDGVIIGRVVTAFPTRKIKPREVQRWP